jgi:SAM-dependent methyltransferase
MPLNPHQQTQESQYAFPYHYLDVGSDHHRQVIAIEYLSLLNRVKRQLAPFHGQSILDAGCGDGRFCYELRSERAEVTGVDYSERALAFARAFNPDVQFHCQPLHTLELGREFDAITLIEVIEHIPPPLLPQAIQRIARHLSSAGRLVVTVPSKNLPLSPKHEQHFDEASLRAVLEPSFTVESVTGYARTGWERRIYLLLRQAGALLYPPSVVVPELRRYYDLLSAFYERFGASGPPEACRGLIAVCRRR